MKNTVALMRHGSQRLTGKNTAGSSALTLPTKCTLIVVLWLRSAQMSPEDRAVLFLKITSKKSICTVDGTSRRSAPPSRSVEMKTTAGFALWDTLRNCSSLRLGQPWHLAQ